MIFGEYSLLYYIIYLFNFYYFLKLTSFSPKTTFLETIFSTYIIPVFTELSLRNIYSIYALKAL
jgi:hypothetical protein